MSDSHPPQSPQSIRAEAIEKLLIERGLLTESLIDDVIVMPTVLRHAIHLHPVLIVFSLLAGAQLFGFWGLLFGVPVACMTKALIQVIWQWYRSQFGTLPVAAMPEISRIPLI